ncbi:hypothetical protein R1sor_004830 [Riccia sorocarpa]|uniref:Uncharacterized protein n=1 Tax=Riccia sorocarpa TaxID=122646 RepID=A0ABD3HLQ2_9MARC
MKAVHVLTVSFEVGDHLQLGCPAQPLHGSHITQQLSLVVLNSRSLLILERSSGLLRHQRRFSLFSWELSAAAAYSLRDRGFIAAVACCSTLDVWSFFTS